MIQFRIYPLLQLRLFLKVYPTPLQFDTDTNSTIADLNIPLSDSQALFSLPSLTQARTQSSKLPLTQSASSTSIAKSTSDKFSTGCSAIDKLLGGRGLPRGCILEVSGPPGCGKESVAVGVVRSFLERGEGVLFVGMSKSV